MALLDRLVMVVMSARTPQPAQLASDRTRYAFCFALLHFLSGAVAVDAVLQRYWQYSFMTSNVKLGGLSDLDHEQIKSSQ